MQSAKIARTCSVLVLLWSSIACSATESQATSGSTSDRPIRILALGDSYTIGGSVGRNERWPNYLQRQLQAEGLTVENPEVIAKTGWTSQQLRLQIADKQTYYPYNWVTLMIGVNDQYIGRDPKRFAVDLDWLLTKATELAGGKPERVLVMTIPDWGVSRFQRGVNRRTISAEIAAFNQLLKAKVTTNKATLVDISDLVELARQQRKYLASDGLHFSGAMHKLWAQRAAEQILEIAK